jgi:hypothetical protein
MENEIFFTQGGKIWLGDDGIVRAVSTIRQEEMTLANTKATFSAILKVSKGKKRPLFSDIRDIKSADRESREYAASEEVVNVVSAMALLIGSPISKVIGNFFLGLNKPKFPVKLFTSETEAIEWLKGFIE